MATAPEDRHPSVGEAASTARPLRHMIRWGALVAGALLPVVVLGILAVHLAARSANRLVERSNATAASMAAELVNRELQQSLSLAGAIAALPGLTDAVARHEEDAVRAYLEPFVQSYPDVDRAFVTDTEGLLWSDSPRAPESLGRRFDQRDWFRGVTNGWGAYISEVYRRHAEPQPLVVAVARPVFDARGAAIGILVLQHRLDILAAWVEEMVIGESGYVFLLDPRGNVAAHPHLDLRSRVHDQYASLPFVRAGLRGNRWSGIYDDPLTGVRLTAVGVPVREGAQHWLLVACQPLADAHRPIRLLTRQIGGAALLLAALAGFVVAVLGRTTARNERLIREMAQHNEALERLSSDLVRQHAALEAANAELESFSYSVSHDLRSPLLAMDGFSLALAEDYGDKLDAQGHDYLSRIRAACQRMSTLIDDILSLSRVSRTLMQRAPVDLSALVRSLCERLQEETPERNVQVVIQPDVRAEGDANLLAIALENLLRNAWKFTGRREQARIEFGVTTRDGRAAYFVRDNGAGFNMAHADKLFSPFQRLHTTREFPGTGIGLAIVHSIVRRHGGVVSAEGKTGEGATFTFTL